MIDEAGVLAYVNQIAEANGLTYQGIRVWLERQKNWDPWTTAVVTAQVELPELLAWADHFGDVRMIEVVELQGRTNIHLRVRRDSIEIRLSVWALGVDPPQLLPGVDLKWSLPVAYITVDDLRTAVNR